MYYQDVMPNGLLTCAEYEKIVKAKKALADAEVVLGKVIRRSSGKVKLEKQSRLRKGKSIDKLSSN